MEVNNIDFILKYWIEFLFTFLCTGTLYIFKQYRGLKKGMISLLKSEILRICEGAFDLGYCPSYMKENVKEMYESYHNLGGNGMVTIVVDSLYKLPNFRKDVKKDGKNKKGID